MSAAAAQPAHLLAVPNVSEGTDERVIGLITDAIAAEAAVLDTHSDAIHNRTVFTLAPHADRAGAALAAVAGAAMEHIDLRDHTGEHPRIGALDVAPVIWLEPGRREAAQAEALRAAAAIADLEVPVFLYGDLARAPERRERAFFRNGGLAALGARMAAGELQPDFGPAEPHPSAGATLVTARPPLAAFNVELDGASLAAAREIASVLRESGGGPVGVRAIGLELGEGLTQVSTNVHDPIAVPLAEVVARVAELAAGHGARVVAAEIVGLVPRAALVGFPADVPVPGFDPVRGVLEERLRQVAE